MPPGAIYLPIVLPLISGLNLNQVFGDEAPAGASRKFVEVGRHPCKNK